MPLKNARIHLRVTDEEKQSLVEKAAMARQSVSQYILSLSEVNIPKPSLKRQWDIQQILLIQIQAI